MLLSLKYLISEKSSATGRIEIDDHTLRFHASGLLPERKYILFVLSKNGQSVLQEELFSDCGGEIVYEAAFEGMHTMVCFLSSDNFRCVLREETLENLRIYAVLYNAQSRTAHVTKNIPDSVEHTKVSFEPLRAEDPDYRNATNLRTQNASAPVDLLPDLQWPNKIGDFRMYFNLSDAVSSPIPAGKYWQFVEAPSSADQLNMKLFLGKYCLKGKIRAFAKILESTKANSPHYEIPGFQYKKTPDGRSFWISIQEL